MTRAEFEDRVAKILCDPGFVASSEDWADISMVYQFHPAISQDNDKGKEEIANYYTLGIWRDMIPAAKESKRLHAEPTSLTNDRSMIEAEYKAQLKAIDQNIADSNERLYAFIRKYRRYV
jgi:hypothetical protein